MIDEKTRTLLIEKASGMREMSYCVYSGFAVGAALLDVNGNVYTGCNIESASFSPTVCAERVAVFKAVSDGVKEFKAIAVVGGEKGKEASGLFPPCGVCRQVLMEFCDPENFEVVVARNAEDFVSYRLKDLLPLGFGPSYMS